MKVLHFSRIRLNNQPSDPVDWFNLVHYNKIDPSLTYCKTNIFTDEMIYICFKGQGILDGWW